MSERKKRSFQGQRAWNSNILPGFGVIAVDERVPEVPENVIVERVIKRQYPINETLRNDPSLKRWVRLRLEAAIRINNEEIMPYGEFIEALKYALKTGQGRRARFNMKMALEDCYTYPSLLDDLRN